MKPTALALGLGILRWLAAACCVVALASCGGGDDAAAAAKELVSFSFLAADNGPDNGPDNGALAADVHATIDGDHITAAVPSGTDVTRLVATFATTGALVTVGGASQISGQTANDFTAPVIYRVTAADQTTRSFTVTVAIRPSGAKELTSFAFLDAQNPALTTDVTAAINGAAILATVPYGTDVSALVATFTTTGASVAVGGAAQTSGQTANDFRGPVVYRVTAADGTTQDFTVTVRIAPNTAKDLTAFRFLASSNPQLPADVTGTIAGTAVAVTVPYGTNPAVLIASFETTGTSVAIGTTLQVSGQTANDFRSPVIYRVTAGDGTTRDFIVTVTVAKNPAKDLTSFKLLAVNNPALTADVTAAINGAAITAAVPLGTDRTALIATFTHTGVSVTVGGTAQTSGQTANDLRGPVVYRVTADDGTTKDYTVKVTVGPTSEAYVKASNTGAGDGYGMTVALSADGTTLAVGAPYEDSAAAGVGGNQADNSMQDAGAVYIYVRAGSTWAQQAYLKASNPGVFDDFGYTVALSADGNTLAVGAINEDSAAPGIDGNQADDSAPAAGAVYVFTRSGTTWTQQAYVKASDPGQVDQFGLALGLAADGNTLAVGSPGEDCDSTGINGNQDNRNAPNVGATYVFTRAGTTWSQQAYIKAASHTTEDTFGSELALSADGNTLAVAADEEDTVAGNSGAAYVFTRAGTTWTQQIKLKASNPGTSDQFGSSIALASADGNTLVVGARYEDSAALGINGNQLDNTAPDSGAAYVFTRAGTAWTQQAYVKAFNTLDNSLLGESCALSADGTTLLIGAKRDNAVGAVYLLTRVGTSWSHQAFVRASNPELLDEYGFSVALASDGRTFAVGADLEDSAATGIGGNKASNAAQDSGAVYVHR